MEHPYVEPHQACDDAWHEAEDEHHIDDHYSSDGALRSLFLHLNPLYLAGDLDGAENEQKQRQEEL